MQGGEVGRQLVVIVDGEVEVTREGKRIATGGRGEFFGEIALLEETPRMASVTAKTPVRCFVLTRRDFRPMVEENPSVERKVLRPRARRVMELSGDPTLA